MSMIGLAQESKIYRAFEEDLGTVEVECKRKLNRSTDIDRASRDAFERFKQLMTAHKELEQPIVGLILLTVKGFFTGKDVIQKDVRRFIRHPSDPIDLRWYDLCIKNLKR